MRYLNPKADLPFRRVFGEHPDLAISLLNALLPFTPEQEITEIEYLTAEMVPDNPLRRFSIVDVRCKDKKGRQFIVEIQMIWSKEFKVRVHLNDSKVIVWQMGSRKEFELLQPVYSLNLANEILEPKTKEYYHHYKMVYLENSDNAINNLQLILVELPKFTPHSYAEKKMQVLWLRYLTEIDENSREVPKELLANPEIKKAVTALEESAFTPAQLLGYEKFWDIISTEKTLINSSIRKGKAEGLEEGLEKGKAEGLVEGLEKGLAEGLEKGLAEGLEKGLMKAKQDDARKMKALGLDKELIINITGLTSEQIDAL